MHAAVQVVKFEKNNEDQDALNSIEGPRRQTLMCNEVFVGERECVVLGKQSRGNGCGRIVRELSIVKFCTYQEKKIDGIAILFLEIPPNRMGVGFCSLLERNQTQCYSFPLKVHFYHRVERPFLLIENLAAQNGIENAPIMTTGMRPMVPLCWGPHSNGMLYKNGRGIRHDADGIVSF